MRPMRLLIAGAVVSQIADLLSARPEGEIGLIGRSVVGNPPAALSAKYLLLAFVIFVAVLARRTRWHAIAPIVLVFCSTAGLVGWWSNQGGEVDFTATAIIVVMAILFGAIGWEAYRRDRQEASRRASAPTPTPVKREPRGRVKR